MNRRTFFTFATAATLGVALFAVHPQAQTTPTSAGTWDLDVAASKSTDPMPKSIVRTYEVTGTTEKLTGTIVNAEGKTIPIAFTATLDGKDSPSTTTPGADTLVLTQVDALTMSYVNKLAGKEVASGTRVLSPDGKTMTFMQKGTNAAGKPFESTMVYRRR
jgi:hypothetical protein